LIVDAVWFDRLQLIKEVNYMNVIVIFVNLVNKYAKSFGLALLLISSASFAQQKADAAKKAPSTVFGQLHEQDAQADDENGNSEDKNATLPPSNSNSEPLVDNRTTAEKLESLKNEVLAVNRDLFILEEDLLFPASTQLATYFSVDIGYFFSLDNIKLKLDGKQVTHHLYTEKDVSALYRGAIQKVFLGNVSTGEHELVAILIGKGPHKRKYRRAVSFTFKKGTEAKALEIQLRDDEGKLQPKLSVVEW
jgi:hypothetical protein